MDKERLDHLIDALNEGSISPDDHQELMLYYNSFQVNNTWDASMGDYEETKARIFSKIVRKERYRKVRSLRSVISWSAASVFLVGLLWFGYAKLIDDDLIVVRTDKMPKEVVFPDGSKVVLNTNSELTYPKVFSDLRREIKFEGEGYFEIAKDSLHPFVIETDLIKVKVLGTEFNLKAYKDDPKFETSLIEGTVVLLTKDEKNTLSVLAPKQKFIVEREGSNQVTTAELKTAVVPIAYMDEDPKAPVDLAWKEGKLAFHSASLTDIARVLDRKFSVDVKITDPAVAEYRFTATFEGETLEEILAALRISKQFNYRKEGNEIIIY